MEKSTPADLSENPEVDLPLAPQQIAKQHPDVWAALQQLGAALNQAGPLDGRTKRLVHLALAIGANSRGAVHSHTRRGLDEGLAAAGTRARRIVGGNDARMAASGQRAYVGKGRDGTGVRQIARVRRSSGA